MGTMNISLPGRLKSFVDEQVAQHGYGTSSEYVRELIRHDQDRQRLRRLLLDGAASVPGLPADAAYFDALRERIRKAARPGKRGGRPGPSSRADRQAGTPRKRSITSTRHARKCGPSSQGGNTDDSEAMKELCCMPEGRAPFCAKAGLPFQTGNRYLKSRA